MKNKEFLKTRFIFQYVKCAEVLVKSILWEHIHADSRVDRMDMGDVVETGLLNRIITMRKM